MWIDILVELIGRNWSRRWARVRALSLLALCLAAPRLVTAGVMWYAERQARPWVDVVTDLVPSVSPSTATPLPPRR